MSLTAPRGALGRTGAALALALVMTFAAIGATRAVALPLPTGLSQLLAVPVEALASSKVPLTGKIGVDE